MKTILTFAALLFIISSFGQAGMLDPTFGNGGESLILTNNKSGGCINDIAQQADGKIVAAAEEFYNTQIYNPLVVRFNTDGTPDSSFGTNGFADVAIHSSRRYDEGLAVKILNDGKILVLINAENPKTLDPDIYLIRLNANGSKDSSFGKNGVAIKDKGIDYAYPMQVQEDGKILVGGQINSVGCMLRCNADGSTDTTFGNRGLLVLQSLKHSSYIVAITLTSDHKILVGGSGRPSVRSYPVAFINRYNTDGTIDSSFGVNGSIVKQTSKYSQGVSSMVVLPDGKFLVSYSLSQNQYYYSVDALAKYNADGSVDSSFGRGGKVTSGIPEDLSFYRTSELGVQEGGKIVLAGQALKHGKYGIAVSRLLPNGEMDPSFGNKGSVFTHHYYNKPTSMLIQQDEKIVVGGCIQEKYVSKWHLSLSRYLSADNNITILRKENIIADHKVMLYPNPVKDILHLHGLNGKTVTVVNMQGMIVKRIVVNADTYNVNVSAFAKGMYYLKVEGDKNNTAYKFIKE